MAKIIDYAILSNDASERLDYAVNNAIKEGWQPFGGIAISLCETDDSRYAEYAQAMVKYEEKENIMDALVGQAVMHTPIVPTSVDIPTSNHMSRYSNLYVSE